jgi:hypothetical protein
LKTGAQKEMTMDIFSNPWVVGISGGILSGLIVAYVSRLIFSKRDNREYAQKISLANHEVLYAVRPGISEGVVPTNAVLRSLIEATARKYAVDVPDMHDLNDVSSELIKEVMDSSFISASAKQEFCEKLTSIKEEEAIPERGEFEKEYDISARYRRQVVAILSAMVGILTGLAGVAITLMEKTTIFEPKNIAFMAIPAVVAILISFIAVMVRGLQKMHMKSFKLRIAGLETEFRPKSDDARNNN